MLSLVNGVKANNNEEYKKVIKSRMNIMLLLFMIGGVTLAVAILAKTVWTVEISDRMLGVYTGVGSGLLLVSTILWIKNKLLLNNDAKLKESRLMNTDERIKEISNTAFRTATYILLISLYAVALIGGLFYPILTELLSFLVCIFLLAYTIAFKIYERRM